MSNTFSVVIPTYNRLTDLKTVLAALDEQTLPAGWLLEVVVVDDGSGDGTESFLQTWQRERRVATSQANAGPAKARNRGVELAGGELIAFLGDDTIPQPGWALEHLECHRLNVEPVAVLGYTSFPPEMETPFLRWINEYGAQFGYSIIEDPCNVPFNFFYTSNISLSRAVFAGYGGFREDFPAAAWEDIEFAYRACNDGMRIVYQARARTLHRHRIRPGTFCRRQRTAGRSGAIFAKLHPELGDFLGLYRLTGRRPMGAVARWALAFVISCGEAVPGLTPPGAYRRLLDEYYLDGLAEGLHSG